MRPAFTEEFALPVSPSAMPIQCLVPLIRGPESLVSFSGHLS